MNPTPENPSLARKRGWIHFGVVAGFLLIVSVGWNVAMDRLGYWFRKEPISWPAGVEVNHKTFQNMSFPLRIGPYRMYEELKHADDMLSTLKVATTLDEQRYPDRQSNWYINRIYEDEREPEHSPFRFWHLDVVYYTGGEVTVPHVPDICVQAGGATPTGRKILTVENVRDVPDSWKTTPFVALGYVREFEGRTQELAQYYLFDVNGIPETDRKMVRFQLAYPTKRYVFYSKIQFFPRGSVGDPRLADEKAEDFLRHCLPDVLAQLPSEEAIRRLYEEKQKNEE